MTISHFAQLALCALLWLAVPSVWRMWQGGWYVPRFVRVWLARRMKRRIEREACR